MKKMLIALLLVGLIKTVQAEDLIQTTLLEHVAPVTQFKSGETKIALVDSVVRIGSVKGRSILDLQAGFSGEVAPQPGEVSGANVIAGGFFKISSLVHNKINFPLHWEFLRSLEYGPVYFYDFRDSSDYVAFQVGMAFELKPKL